VVHAGTRRRWGVVEERDCGRSRARLNRRPLCGESLESAAKSKPPEPSYARGQYSDLYSPAHAATTNTPRPKFSPENHKSKRAEGSWATSIESKRAERRRATSIAYSPSVIPLS